MPVQHHATSELETSLQTSWINGIQVRVEEKERMDGDIFFFFFCAPWAYYTVFSGAGVVSGTLHPAVWDTHIIRIIIP
jgi:hypothetical protein